MKRIAILISNVGKGSNLQAIVDAVNSKKINAKIVAVISDTNDAIGLKHAIRNKIPIKICANKKDLLQVFKRLKPDYIALAGWKQIILDEVIEFYPNQILNLHPGLIPNSVKSKVLAPDGTNTLWNKGLLAEKAVQNFLDKKSTYAGSSIHLLTKEFDFGPVLERAFEKIKKNDTVKTLYARLKNKEHEIYIKALQKLTNAISQDAAVLIIDGGGRAHALVNKYLQSKHVKRVIAIPGNDLMTLSKNVKTYPQIKTTDIKQIVNICKKENVDLVDVAQDDAIAAGLVDTLVKSGLKVFGPTKAAGRVEWDKAWARNFMKKFKIPHPAFKICKSQKEGVEFINSQREGTWYIKAAGLAAGKGALLASSNSEAQDAIKQMKKFGNAGQIFLIEKCINGEEFSSFAIVNGKKFAIIGHAQDHKTVFDGNVGPNTGGMGCSSPPMVITAKIGEQIKSIFQKTVGGLVKVGRPYLGMLYLGGIIDKSGKVFVIEFNARWGDPEAQVILPSVKNDLFELVTQTILGKIPKITKDNSYRVVVTAASRGYPINHSKVIGKEIIGLSSLLGHPERSEGSLKIFGAGVKVKNGKYLAAGGRLFYVLGEGKNVELARRVAYNTLSQVSIDGDNLHFRKDIGLQDLQRLLSPK